MKGKVVVFLTVCLLVLSCSVAGAKNKAIRRRQEAARREKAYGSQIQSQAGRRKSSVISNAPGSHLNGRHLPDTSGVINAEMDNILQGGMNAGGDDIPIDEDSWDQSGLKDLTGKDYNEFSSDEERLDAVKAEEWKQSGAEEGTGKDYGSYDNDADRNNDLNQLGESQGSGKSDNDDGENGNDDMDIYDRGSDAESSDSSSNEIVGPQGPGGPLPSPR